MKLIVQIALGVCLGIMLSGILSIVLWGTVLLKLIPLLSTEVMNKTLVETEKHKTIMLKPTQELGTQQIQSSPVSALKTDNTQTATEIQEQQQQFAAQEEQKKKAEKFKAYYQKSEKCDPPGSHEIRVECGNEYMRAKAKFEELYKQGKI